MSALDLSHIRLAIFMGCETGAGRETANNLPSVAVQQGATVAIGFDNKIDQGEVESWSEQFFKKLKDGKNVSDACSELNGTFKKANTIVYGDGSVMFN